MIPGNRRSAARKAWWAALRLGASLVGREPRLGIKRLALPVGYWRVAEFAYALERLPRDPDLRVLDLGSPKQLGAILARHHGQTVVSTDILAEEAALTRSYAHAPGPNHGSRVGRLLAAVVDGRGLPFRNAEFDLAFSVSVLEHIPERGDTAAIRELTRVLKPGGRAVITVPFAFEHRDTLVEADVYERQCVGDEALFYQRHYDERTLRTRLIDPSGARLVDLEFWGENSLGVESWLGRLGAASAAIAPLEAPLAFAFLSRLPGPTGRAKAAFFTLEKP